MALQMLSLFSGIGAFEKALTNLGVPYDLVAYCEIDKYASKSYSAIHGVPETLNVGDITKVDESSLPQHLDLVTYGFPCQDISVAGKQKGLFHEDGTQTRSGLFFEALRIIEATQPRVAIAENVKNLTGKKFKEQFDIVLRSLEDAGYNNYWAVLNAKDYGVPQNRERVFIVSIRKDIDTGYFKFPESIPLQLCLRDVMEDEVEDRFYIKNYDSVTFVNEYYGVINGGTIGKMHDVSRRAYFEHGVSPTIHTCGGGNTEPKVICLNSKGGRKGVPGLQPSLNDRIYDCNGLATAYTTAPFFMPNYTTPYTAVAIRGRYNEDGVVEQHLEMSDREYANAITTVQKDSLIHDGLGIRKLIPKECFRLMGFTDEDFEKASAVVSNSQLYKQAGNSVVVPVVEHIIRRLFKCWVLQH